jgi:hypothetical protein
MTSGADRGTLKPERILVAGLLCLVLIASPAFASSGGTKQSQSLSLTLEGMITNAGSQSYEIGGGQLVGGSLFGQALAPSEMSFSLDASVHGPQAASGWGSIQLGTSFSARVTITGVIAAAVFPLSPTDYSNCNPKKQTCNSEIPLFFTGMATITKGGNGLYQIPIAIESPYWNPFGGPIVITSLDSITDPSISLVVSYTSATIYWSGVQIQGVISGSLGGGSVSGSFSQTINSWENLVSATESDFGSIAFVGMSNPSLNAYGGFVGHTTFSLANSYDCASEFGLPEGTCTATGATSDGSFWMIGRGSLISGTYHTVWSVPSLFTTTTVMAAVTKY